MTPGTISPRTNLERELVRIWEEVVQRAPIGIQEDFFDLEGLPSARTISIASRLPLGLPGRVRDKFQDLPQAGPICADSFDLHVFKKPLSLWLGKTD